MSTRRFDTQTRDGRALSVVTGYDPVLARHWLLVLGPANDVVFNNLRADHWPSGTLTERGVIRVLKEHLRVPTPATLLADLTRDRQTSDARTDMTYEATALRKGNP